MNICLYHGIDLDGFCSGAIYAQQMESLGEEFELIPANYGWELPWKKFDGANVTLVDFSMQPHSAWERLATVAQRIVWIDHHKSAIDEWNQSESGAGWCPIGTSLDVKKAGCELAWEYFHPHVVMPMAVRLLGRYDVWDHASSSDVLPFQYGMRLYDMDPADDWTKWADYLDVSISPEVCEPRIREGHTVLRYQTREDEVGAKTCFTLTWEDMRWIAANRGGRGSKFFDSVWDAEQFDAMMSFAWDGETWTFGLYTDKPGVDCGAIAKRLGGGGHPGAAGFQSAILPFDLMDTQRLTSALPSG